MKIGLIDLSSIFWAAWHATKDQEIGTAFENSISAVTRFAGGFDHVAICIDSPPYKRKGISADYKAQRPPKTESAVEQFTRVKARLIQDGFPLFAVQGAEADDVIATIVTQLNDGEDAFDPVESIQILTGDKDIDQLVSETVFTVSTSDGSLRDIPAVAQKYGVMPSHLHDSLALCGDISDNIPGVKNIGPKRAAQLIKMFGSVPSIISRIRTETFSHADLPDKMADVIRDSVDQLEQSYELVKLVRDLDIDLAPLFARREPKSLTGDTGMQQTAPVSIPIPIPIPEHAPLAKLEQQPETAIVKPNVQVLAVDWNKELEPRTGQDAQRLAGLLHNSRLYQKNFGNEFAVLAIILRGRALGLDATTALEAFYFDSRTGSLLPVASIIIGMCMRSELSEYFRCVSTDDKQATYETKRVGDPPMSYQYTWEMAVKADLTGLTHNKEKTNWHKRPDAMIRKTTGVNLARIVYPDLIKGLYSHEEMEGA